MLTIGSYIKTRRIEKGWTRKELSKKAKVSEIEIFRVENNKRKSINLQIINKLVKALDISLVNMLIETRFSNPMTDAEKRLLTDPHFAKVFFELDRLKDLDEKDKKQLADILLRIIMSFLESGK